MELNRLKSTGKAKGSEGFLKTKYNKVKDFFYPATNERRKERFGQYKDLGMFFAAIITVVLLEDKIKSAL